MSIFKAIRNRDLKQLHALIAAGEDLNQADQDGETPLQLATRKDNLEFVRILIRSGATLDYLDDDSPLEQAVWEGYDDIFKVLLRQFPYGPETKKPYAEAVHVAVITGKVEMVKALLKAGQPIDASVNESGTMLHVAIERGQLDVAKTLLKLRAKVDSRNDHPEVDGDYAQHTPLMTAIQQCENPMGTPMDAIPLLLDAGADVNATAGNGQTPLLIAAEVDSLKAAQLLIERGAAVNIQDATGRSPLIWAADHGNSALAKLLIESGAEVNQHDNDGNSALIYAKQNELIELDQADDEALLAYDIACQSERYEKLNKKRQFLRRRRILKYLREAGATEEGSRELLLVKAAKQGKVGEVEALIDIGAKVNQLVPNYDTALSQAVENGHLEVVRTLLDEGADPNVHERCRAPLLKAAEAGELAIAQQLLNAGANPHASNAFDEDGEWEGYTALDLAQRKGHRDLVKLLRQNGGRRPRREPIETRRGIVSTNLNDQLILVQAPVNEVSQALSVVRQATTLKRDVFEQEVELTNECFTVFQFTDHSWSVIKDENVYQSKNNLNEADAQAISKQLGVKAIDYGVSDTAGAMDYSLYEKGELLESYSYCCDNEYSAETAANAAPNTFYGGRSKFYSTLRQPDLDLLDRDEAFADVFFKSQDAYVPAWGGYYGMSAMGIKRFLAVEGLDPEDLKMDYVAVD